MVERGLASASGTPRLTETGTSRSDSTSNEIGMSSARSISRAFRPTFEPVRLSSR